MSQLLVIVACRWMVYLLLLLAFGMTHCSSFGADPSEVVQEGSFESYVHHLTPLSNVIFVAFDTETTGLSPTKDRIVELGAVKFRSGKVLETKSWLIQPGRDIPYKAIEIHGIDNDMVKDEPSFKEIYPSFRQFIDGTVLIAHNARFDIAFMKEELMRNDLKPPPSVVIDSLSLFRNWFPESQSHSLEGLSTYLNINPGALHRALADSWLIFRILSKGLDTRDGVHTLGDLQESATPSITF